MATTQVEKKQENGDVMNQMAEFAGNTVTSGLNTGIGMLKDAVSKIDQPTAAEIGRKLGILLDALPLDKLINLGTKSAGVLLEDGINVGLNAVGVIPGAGEVIELIRTLSNMVHAGLTIANTGIELADTAASTVKEVNSKITATVGSAESGINSTDSGHPVNVMKGLWDTHGSKLTQMTGYNSASDFINKSKQAATGLLNTSKLAPTLAPKRITFDEIKNSTDMESYINKILAAAGIKKKQYTSKRIITEKPLTIADIKLDAQNKTPIYTEDYLNKKLAESYLTGTNGKLLTINDIINNQKVYTPDYLIKNLAIPIKDKQNANISMTDKLLAATGATQKQGMVESVFYKKKPITSDYLLKNPGVAIDAATTGAHSAINAAASLYQPTTVSGRLAKSMGTSMMRTGVSTFGQGTKMVANTLKGGYTRKMRGGMKKIKRRTKRRALIGGRILTSINEFKTGIATR